MKFLTKLIPQRKRDRIITAVLVAALTGLCIKLGLPDEIASQVAETVAEAVIE